MIFMNVCPVCFCSSRLCAGRDQAHHLPGGTQAGRPGRGQHSHGAERRAGGPGVPAQERADPQVARLVVIELPPP